MKLLASLAIATAAFALSPVARADDPSLHEVYQAVHAGRLGDAQTMMTRVLRDHPDSAKAHYVEAEVLVRMDRAEDARSELARAERLAPGLPFAKPDAVRDLRGLIAERGRVHPLGVDRPVAVAAETRPADSGFPWGLLLLLGGAGLALFLFLRNRRYAMVSGSGPMVMGPGGTPYGPAPYGPAPYGPAPYGAPMGGGIGSGIVGGLATGAALGAGMVAGEALAHNLMGNHDRDRISDGSGSDGSRVAYDDGGGRDFGVADSDSWDSGSGADIAGDGGGGGGGDWG